MFEEFIEALAEYVADETGVPCLVGANAAVESMGVDGEAVTTGITYGNHRFYEMTVLLNGKSGDQQKIMNAMETAHRSLCANYGQGAGDLEYEDVQIYSCETVASPHLIGREDGNRTQYLYASSLLFKMYVSYNDEGD